MLLYLILSGVARAQLSEDITARDILTRAECPCDVTRNSCDPNCCCDSSCSNDDEARFWTCQEEVPSPSLDYCIEEDRVAKVRLSAAVAIVCDKTEVAQCSRGTALLPLAVPGMSTSTRGGSTASRQQCTR